MKSVCASFAAATGAVADGISSSKTVEEALDIANGTRYGLGGAVFGRDRRECEAGAAEMRCGMVSINDFAVT